MTSDDEQRTPSVLAGLPRTRPQRSSARRTPRAEAPAPAPAAAPRAKAPEPAPQPLIATALQAAGELAQVGVAVGTKALRETLGRLRGR